jgi:fermentation-respiration switch protein FrsA (DUF1100 family)
LDKRIGIRVQTAACIAKHRRIRAIARSLPNNSKLSPIAGLIVDSSFTSAADMARVIYPVIPAFLFKTKLDSINKIGKVSAPKLFLHSPEDEIVPYALGRKLYEAAPEPKQFFEIIGGHNDGHLHDEDKIQNGMAKFLKEQNLI